jgi:hypothetical protein
VKIRDKYCRLSELDQDQINKLRGLMPSSKWFNFYTGEALIGFDEDHDAGTWVNKKGRIPITYKEMLSLLGEKEEQKLVPHVHQKEIIAWSNGEEIEILLSSASPPEWVALPSPEWAIGSSYRVKPKLTPEKILDVKPPLKEFIMLEFISKDLSFGLAVSKCVNLWISRGYLPLGGQFHVGGTLYFPMVLRENR